MSLERWGEWEWQPVPPESTDASLIAELEWDQAVMDAVVALLRKK
jgi:hypothetical protein